jgi:thioredoxin reductase (NADPH)
MTAFQRRRSQLTTTLFEGLRVYGHKDCSATRNIQEFFYRNGVPHTWKNIDDPEVAARLATKEIPLDQTPVITYGDKELFCQPTLVELAEHIGIRRKTEGKRYDVFIIGAGPSGLGAAVYASSEGLCTVVIDSIGPGGQAGSSSKIENYAGFPAGLSGRELALRSYLQALKFGTEFIVPCSVQNIHRQEDGAYGIELCTGEWEQLDGQSEAA